MKKKLTLLFAFVVHFFSLAAQSTAGITGVPDTSFTVYSEYQKHHKKYPYIRIVEPFNLESVEEAYSISYCQNRGRHLRLDVFYPKQKSKQKRAAVMIIHGGGWRSGNRKQHQPLAQRLAELGYVVFTPEFRLSTEATYPAAVHDLKAAVRWIRAHANEYHIDPSRVAILGFSAGGQLAALLGSTNNNPSFEGSVCNLKSSSAANAVIDIDGILSFVHPESGEGDDTKKPSAATLWFGYSKKDNPQLWEDASPLKHVSRHTPPTLFINSSVARMHAGRDDYMKVLRHHNIHTDVKTFRDAPHSFPLFHPWFELTLKYADDFLKHVFKNNTHAVVAARNKIIVAKDGTGDFTTVQAAFNAIPLNNKKRCTIYVKNGIYHEKLRLDSSKNFVSLIGEDKFKTVLTYNDHSGKIAPHGDTINTFTSFSFLQLADDFTAENITFENTAGNAAGQAVAMHIMGDRVQFYNCRFLGHQDVLYTGRPAMRQYFSHCYIEGTTDFIFGSSIAWFQQCHINSKRNSHVTAAATPKDQEFGYIFNDCVLTTDSLKVDKVSLGRPWRPYSNVVYINCYMGAHILPEGWNNWRNAENEKTARYAEYKSYGPGANPFKRYAWTRQLSDEEVKQYTIKNVFKDWNPK